MTYSACDFMDDVLNELRSELNPDHVAHLSGKDDVQGQWFILARDAIIGLKQRPRPPSEEEKQSFRNYLIRQMSNDESGVEEYMSCAAAMMVIDRYITDGPGYHGKLLIVVWSGGPELTETFVQSQQGGWRLAEPAPRGFQVCLPTTEPHDAELLRYMADHRVTRTIDKRTEGSGFEEYWYKAEQRKTLETMIASFWGDVDQAEQIHAA